MKLTRLNPRIWLTEVKLDGFSVRGAVIEGRDQVLVLDPLSHPDDMAEVRPLIRDKALVVVYSHADWDHIWGTCGLPLANCRVIAHQACLARFNTDVPATLDQMKSQSPGTWDAVRLIRPDTVFDTRMELDLGECKAVLSHLPGHTSDAIVLFLPDFGLAFMGDTVESPLPCLSTDTGLDDWIRELETWAADPRVSQIIPSHGPMGGREVILETLDYLKAMVLGCSPELPIPLNRFYRETHEENLAIVRNLYT